MIGGKPLGPSATRAMILSDFTPELVAEIEQHQIWGNVQLLKVGRGGGEVNFDELRKTLGWEKPRVSKAAPPVQPKPADVKPTEEHAETGETGSEEPEGNEETAPSSGDETSTPAPSDAPTDEPADDKPAAASELEEPPEESGGVDLEEVLDPENPPEPEVEEHAYTMDELMALKAADLKKIIVSFPDGKVGSLKKKSDLAEEILRLQSAEGGD
jgi:hypothetical protein